MTTRLRPRRKVARARDSNELLPFNRRQLNVGGKLASRMKRFQLQRPVLANIALMLPLVFMTACRSGPPQQLLNRPMSRPINSIRVGTFQCENEVTGEAVRNVFLELLARYGDAKVVRAGEADVLVEGTVTLAKWDSGSVRVGGGGDVFAGKGHRVAGDFVSGVTSVVMRDGQVLASASWGQNVGKGNELMAPESVAHRAADRLLGQLSREGLKRR